VPLLISGGRSSLSPGVHIYVVPRPAATDRAYPLKFRRSSRSRDGSLSRDSALDIERETEERRALRPVWLCQTPNKRTPPERRIGKTPPCAIRRPKRQFLRQVNRWYSPLLPERSVFSGRGGISRSTFFVGSCEHQVTPPCAPWESGGRHSRGLAIGKMPKRCRVVSTTGRPDSTLALSSPRQACGFRQPLPVQLRASRYEITRHCQGDGRKGVSSSHRRLKRLGIVKTEGLIAVKKLPPE